MKENDLYTVKIYDYDSIGRGIAKIGDLVVFVEGALIDEEVDVVITKIKKNYCEAKTAEIRQNSLNRHIYPCKYYNECGGCDLGHFSYISQLDFKKKKVINAMERIGSLKDVNILDVVKSDNTNYRNKVTLKVVSDSIGFFKKNTYEVIGIDSCLISNKKINTIIKALNEFIKDYRTHNINEIFIRSDEETMICISSASFHLQEELISALKGLEIDSIILNNKTIYGNDFISMNLLGNTFRVSSESFFQININQTERLYKNVLEYAGLKKKDVVLDLYCGVGTITSLLSKKCKKVIGIEVVESAINNAKENMIINDVENAEFLVGKVEYLLSDIDNKIDVIVLDPPRNGCDIKTINSMIELKPRTIVYISCNPETLARDLKLLSDNYNVIEITPYDMFPNTHHVECIVKLDKK